MPGAPEASADYAPQTGPTRAQSNITNDVRPHARDELTNRARAPRRGAFSVDGQRPSRTPPHQEPSNS